jgi:hypothetical protein
VTESIISAICEFNEDMEFEVAYENFSVANNSKDFGLIRDAETEECYLAYRIKDQICMRPAFVVELLWTSDGSAPPVKMFYDSYNINYDRQTTRSALHTWRASLPSDFNVFKMNFATLDVIRDDMPVLCERNFDVDEFVSNECVQNVSFKHRSQKIVYFKHTAEGLECLEKPDPGAFFIVPKPYYLSVIDLMEYGLQNDYTGLQGEAENYKRFKELYPTIYDKKVNKAHACLGSQEVLDIKTVSTEQFKKIVETTIEVGERLAIKLDGEPQFAIGHLANAINEGRRDAFVDKLVRLKQLSTTGLYNRVIIPCLREKYSSDRNLNDSSLCTLMHTTKAEQWGLRYEKPQLQSSYVWFDAFVNACVRELLGSELFRRVIVKPSRR